jgi:hypothetical protein
VLHFEEFRIPDDNKTGGNAGDREVVGFFSGSVKAGGISAASSSSTGMRGIIGVRLSS